MAAIEGYTELVQVARGATSVVYRARQLAFDRVVAIKVLEVSTVGPDERRRFERECRAVGNLSWHPHVVPVFDAGTTAAGHPYLVMEYLPDHSLAHRIREHGAIPEAEAVRLAMQVTDALAAAHEAGVLHRDVKPANILVSRYGDAKLADFGIAALATSGTDTTTTITGTLSFMSPELLRGERASAVSDVYGMGATLYALLCGRVAYSTPTDESPLAMVMRVANDPLPDPRRFGISDGVAGVVQRAMAKDVGDRTATAADLLAQLRAACRANRWAPPTTYTDRPSGGATAPPDAAPREPAPARPAAPAAPPAGVASPFAPAPPRAVPSPARPTPARPTPARPTAPPASAPAASPHGPSSRPGMRPPGPSSSRPPAARPPSPRPLAPAAPPATPTGWAAPTPAPTPTPAPMPASSGPHPAVAPRTNGFAIAAFLLGLLGFVPLALIFGFLARSRIRASGGAERGRGLATAGIVLALLWLAITVGIWVALISAANA